MRLLGLTGGIGMGKSAAESLLRKRGIPTLDTDLLARQVVEPTEPALAEVLKEFGADLAAADGQLRRDELARRVFGNPPARKRLEEILHPRIRQLWQTQVVRWRSEHVPIAVVIIPLLFETAAESAFDAIVCIACSAATQRQRLLSRAWSPEQIQQRLTAQFPIERKIEKADFVIWTEGGLDIHAAQLEQVLKTLAPED
ncbi:MAG TPA: dephospho-CoA kinase [Candidatus Dormibacteraeota bacterium]|nr:dephospho-CoA kinase [Candidatus Dormibacteraeota bacterium]